MDLSKLQLLNTETLMKMQAEIARVLKDRVDTSIVPGRIGRFTHNGQERMVLIDRVNWKTANCVEISGSVEPGKKWRVGLGGLKVDPVIIKANAVAPSKPAAPTGPLTRVESAW